MARVNYALLDRPRQTVRIRLNSTVVNARHDGDPAKAESVIVSYVRGGQTYQVRGRACVMACWNMVIPYLVPELPATQKEALAFNVKARSSIPASLCATGGRFTSWGSAM